VTGAELVANVLAGLALVVSIGSAFRGERVEQRIQNRADKRDSFDKLLLSPLEGHLALLSQIVRRISCAARDNTDLQERGDAISQLQRSELDQWYFEMDSLCRHENDEFLIDIEADMSLLLDNVLNCINELDTATDKNDVDRLARQIVDYA
jgi:hypothetical protein